MPDLAQRLAARTLELIDIPSESRDEARAAAHVADVLREGGVPVRDLGDTCVLAGRDDAPVLLAATSTRSRRRTIARAASTATACTASARPT